jgi:hypothetical protein
MTNAEVLWASLTPSGEHLLDGGSDLPTARRLLWTLEVGPIPLSSKVEATGGEQRCVNPEHCKVGPPRNPRESPNGVRVSAEAKPYFDAVRSIAAVRGFPDDVFCFAGFAAGLVFLARATVRCIRLAHGSPEHREYVSSMRSFRRRIEEMEFLTGVSVDDAMALAHARNPSLYRQTPVIGAPKLPEEPSKQEPLVVSPDVLALMKVN